MTEIIAPTLCHISMSYDSKLIEFSVFPQIIYKDQYRMKRESMYVNVFLIKIEINSRSIFKVKNNLI